MRMIGNRGATHEKHKGMLIGGSGVLGKELCEPTRQDVLCPSSRDVDFCAEQSVNSVMANGLPECLILTAAYTDVDTCEGQADYALSMERLLWPKPRRGSEQG